MEKTIMDHEYKIVPANDGPAYEGLRDLWSATFHDPPEYIDAFYENFGDEIEGWAVVDGTGSVCSCLTLHLCGEYMGRPVYVSYAIGTRKDSRGRGLGIMLTSFIRDRVANAGGISIVSPAEPSLVIYYSKLGYEPHFLAVDKAVMSPDLDLEEYDECDEFDLDIERADPTPFRTEIDLQPIPREKYDMYREAFLAGRPHIKLSDKLLRYVEKDSMDGCGMCSVNRGDAICVINSADPARVVLAELILNPVLLELSMDIDAEIAAMIARHFDAAETVYKTPGPRECQALVYGLPKTDVPPENGASAGTHIEEIFIQTEEPYYGFPIE